MRVWSFITRLSQLNTYLPYFLPDRLGQLVKSLPDDDIKEILYQPIPNQWEKKMVEQGYNNLGGSIHSMEEFFETRIENLEKSIPPSVTSRNNKRSKKGSKKRKAVTFNNSDDEDLNQGQKGKKFCQYHGTCRHTTDQCTMLKSLVKRAKQKKANVSTRRKGAPNMR